MKNYLKLFAAGIIFLWLFIQSPFNPLYSDYNHAEMSFIKLNFIYWVLASVFILWIIFYVNRLNFEKYSRIIFVCANFLYLSFYIFYGFDVMDTGFSLSKQWSMFHGIWIKNFDAMVGTNLIGGLWLSIYGSPSLIWSRFGFVLVQVSIVWVSYEIMLQYFKPKRIFAVILPLSLFFAVWNYYQTINYDNLPFLFFIISIYFLLKGLKEQPFKKYFFVISGAIIVLAVFCKITYLAALSFPLFLILVYYNLFSKSKKIVKDTFLYYLFGFLIGSVLIVVLLLISGGFDSYILYFVNIIKELISVKNPTKTFSHDHSMQSLYALYKNHTINVITRVVNYTFFILLIEYFRNKTRNFKPMNYFTILTGSFILYFFIFEVNDSNQFNYNMFIYLLSFFISIYILWALFTKNIVIKKYLILIITSLGLFLFAFVGSDLGFRAAFHSNAGLILFTIPII
ncbi:MAG: glycosyltransferase family 39 protein, partial [Bacteroidales bacterium]|nr:glycosyltransferase family 39 protein [Bacteroidales bacterium]